MNQLIYMLRFVLGFGIFGFLSLILILLLPILYLAACRDRQRLMLIVQDVVHYSFRFVFFYLRLIGFLDLRIENHARGQTAKLLVANHISMFDMVAILATFRRCNTFVNRKFLRNPILYPIIKAAGYIPVNPGDPSDLLAGAMRAMQMVSEGATFLVFPEGTRSKTGELARFQPGLFRIAASTQRQYQPIVITSDRPIFNRTGPLHGNSELINFHLHIMEPRLLPLPSARKSELLAYVQDTEALFKGWLSEHWVLAYNRVVQEATP